MRFKCFILVIISYWMLIIYRCLHKSDSHSNGKKLTEKWGKKEEHYLQYALPAQECSHRQYFSLEFVLLDILYFLISFSKGRKKKLNQNPDVTLSTVNRTLSVFHFYKHPTRKLPFTISQNYFDILHRILFALPICPTMHCKSLPLDYTSYLSKVIDFSTSALVLMLSMHFLLFTHKRSYWS